MDDGRFLGEDFIAAVIAAGARARIETLKAGVPVFYLDSKRNLEVMELPTGKKYEIRYLAGKPGDRNYQVIRELDQTTA